jgi:AraC family transcriptional regulator of adaptative response / DNA-3-methyladenine glycosylase II
MRAARKGRDLAPPGVIVLRLPCRAPFDGDAVVEFLAARAVPGIEEVVGTTYRRTLRLAHGAGVAELTPQPDHVRAVLRLDDLRDLTTAVQRCRRVFDLDADPQAVAEQLGADRILGRLVAKTPGLRLPGAVDGFELAARACSGSRSRLRPRAGRSARRLHGRRWRPPTAASPTCSRRPRPS